MNDRNPNLRRLSLAALIALTLCTPISAFAQEGDEDGGGGEEEGKVDALSLLEEANTWARKRQYKKAIPLYKEALQAEPESYPSVYYNLAEIKRFQDDCGEAVILYQRYLVLLPDARDKAQILKAISGCQTKLGALGKLQVTAAELEAATFHINGIPIITGKQLDIDLKPGKYELYVTAVDHDPYKVTVSVPADGTQVEVRLKEKVFTGELILKVNVDGATVAIDGNPAGTTPLAAQKLPAGKHYVELSKDGYFKWVRNVHVPRNDALTIDIELEKQ